MKPTGHIGVVDERDDLIVGTADEIAILYISVNYESRMMRAYSFAQINIEQSFVFDRFFRHDVVDDAISWRSTRRVSGLLLSLSRLMILVRDDMIIQPHWFFILSTVSSASSLGIVPRPTCYVTQRRASPVSMMFPSSGKQLLLILRI